MALDDDMWDGKKQVRTGITKSTPLFHRENWTKQPGNLMEQMVLLIADKKI